MELMCESPEGDRENELLRRAEEVMERTAGLIAEARRLLMESRRIRAELSRTRQDHKYRREATAPAERRGRWRLSARAGETGAGL
jgi:hypothetical protein